MKIKNILAVRNDRFGEFLLNIPSFRALKEKFRGASLTLLVDPYVSDLARSIDFVDEVLTWENRKHRIYEIITFSKRLRNKKFDIEVVFNPSKEFNIINFLSGIPLRVGYARKWDFLLTHKIEDRKYLGDKHEIEYNLELVNLIGAKTEDKSLSLNVDRNIINNLLKESEIKEYDNLVLIHPWTSDSIKQWPLVHFLELIKKMVKEFNLKILIIGGKEHILTSQQLFKDLGQNVIDLTGRTTLKELVALLERCKLLISGDSGPNHLAGAVGVPVISIFRNDIPAKGPTRWGPVSAGSVVIENCNLSDISVDEVFDKAKEVLNK
jgi:heptosyltransferase-2